MIRPLYSYRFSYAESRRNELRLGPCNPSLERHRSNAHPYLKNTRHSYNDVNIKHVFLLAELRKHLHQSFVCHRSLSINIHSKSSEPLTLITESRFTCPKKVITSSIVLKLWGFPGCENREIKLTMKNLINESVHIGIEHIVVILRIKVRYAKTYLRFKILRNQIECLENVCSVSSFGTIDTGEMIVIGMITIQTTCTQHNQKRADCNFGSFSTLFIKSCLYIHLLRSIWSIRSRSTLRSSRSF